jgi:DNA-binding NtrC family response regulator
MIYGETGSGKEIVARAVHYFSARANQPWVDLNCAALPEHLVESELFGHERGAFSGADGSRPGLFELAHTGTMFLDEVGELDPRMQVKLLRVLDGVGYYRVGGRRKIEVDSRIVAATNRDLAAAVAAGRFREDLYHRLNQCCLRVPPLRERPEDLAPLAEFFLAQHSPRAVLSEDAKTAILRHSWPGNARELRNEMIQAAIRATTDEIRARDIPCLANLPAADRAPAPTAPPRSLDRMERDAILRAFRETGGHHHQTAEMLGISIRTLYRKLKLYGPAPAQEDSNAESVGWEAGSR